MSQSFVNTNSFPLELELGLGARPVGEWSLPKINVRFPSVTELSKFLRCPGPEQGMGYRAMRMGAITVLRVRSVWVKPEEVAVD